MKAVAMFKEPFCKKVSRKFPRHEETVVVNPNQTLRYVVVFIKSGLKPQKFRHPPFVILDQMNCWYKPHVLAVMAGQTLKVINNDPGVVHNIHFMAKKNPPLNFGQPGEKTGGMFPSKSIVFYRPEMIHVQCDIHPWMQAIVAVLPNPYFSVTGPDGSFSLPNLPPGHYVLKAWHEKYGVQRINVDLGIRERKEVNFTFGKPDHW